MCAFATIIWSYRSTKIATETELNNQISTKMESLHEKYLAGNLEEIEPNEAMIEIHGHFAAQAEELSKMEELGEDPEAIAGLTNELTRLAEIRHSIDLLRRAEHEVDADKEKTSKTLNKSKWVTFLPLKAFFNTLGFGGKVLAIFGIFSIIPASLVITGPITLSLSEEKAAAFEVDVRE